MRGSHLVSWEQVINLNSSKQKHMKLIKIIFTVLIISNFSCKIYAQKSEVDSIKNESKAQFDVAKATVIIEKRSKEFDNALILEIPLLLGTCTPLTLKYLQTLSGEMQLFGRPEV